MQHGRTMTKTRDATCASNQGSRPASPRVSTGRCPAASRDPSCYYNGPQGNAREVCIMPRVVKIVRCIGLVLSTLGARAAWAQDVPLTPADVVAPVRPAPSRSGGHDVQIGFFGGVFGGSPSLFQPYSLVDGSGSHFAGLDVGYDRHVRPQITIGAAADLAFVAEPVVAATALDEVPTVFGSLRGRLGYMRQPWRAFATGGFAWTRDQVTVVNAPTSGVFAKRLGWTAGAGIERTLTAAWHLNAEYLYARFGAADFGAFADTRVTPTLSMQQLRVGLSYALTGNSRGDDSHAPIAALDLSGWAVHGQITFVSQYAGPFRAPYRGTNSLDADAGRQTADVTLYLGRRLWEGAALWINPEIDQGFGLSNTLGVAGFTSGEAYKLGYSYPYARVPRAFIQQTINLGGLPETVDSSLNQRSEERRVGKECRVREAD